MPPLDYEVVKAPRAITVEEADDLIGLDIDVETEPNLDRAALVQDVATGEPILAYLPFVGDVAGLRRAVLAVPMATTLRGSGTRNISRTFGMASRNVVMRRESCRPAGLALEKPELHAILVGAARDLDAMMEEIAPGVRAKDAETVGGVENDWRIAEDSLWTSGNINYSSALPYHRDRANFATWSAMPVLRRRMRGGYLRVPEYDLTIGCRDGWVVFFNGNLLVHGVTPMEPVAGPDDGYRYSIVYYALRGMKDCFSVAIEQAEARKRRTARERDMVGDPDPKKISGRSTSGAGRIVRD